jgi:GntR family transcriptional regulator
MLKQLVLHDNGIPIYVQLRDQITGLIGRGKLKPGERLPTMREVAVALRIDLNTVQRAYGELERAGLLTLIRGSGTYVAEAPPVQSRKPDAAALAAKVAAQARAEGIAPDELIQALKALKARAS